MGTVDATSLSGNQPIRWLLREQAGSEQHLADGTQIPEEVGRADGQLLAIQSQVLPGLLSQLTKILRVIQMEKCDAGL